MTLKSTGIGTGKVRNRPVWPGAAWAGNDRRFRSVRVDASRSTREDHRTQLRLFNP